MPSPALAVGRRGDVGYRTIHPGRVVAECYVRDQDGTRRRVRATGTSKAVAKCALDDKLEGRGTFLAQEITPDLTVSELTDRWLTQHGQKIAPQTRDKYQRLLDRIIKPGIGNLRIAEATTGRIDTFLRAVAKDTPTLARHTRIVLSGAMSLAVRHDALPANPVRETQVTAKKKAPVRALTAADYHGLRAVVGRWQQGLDKHTGEAQYTTRPRASDLLDVTDLLIATGARIGEVLALRWCDVNLADPDDPGGKSTLEINGTVTHVNGQGLIRQDHPKTVSGWRIITLPDFAVAVLRRLDAERSPMPDDPVFPAGNGNLRSPNNWRRSWRDAIADTEYEWVTPHTFRRSVATLLDRERTAEDAAAQLGHSDTAVTKAHYIEKAHIAPDVSAVLQQFGAVSGSHGT